MRMLWRTRGPWLTATTSSPPQRRKRSASWSSISRLQKNGSGTRRIRCLWTITRLDRRSRLPVIAARSRTRASSALPRALAVMPETSYSLLAKNFLLLIRLGMPSSRHQKKPGTLCLRCYRRLHLYSRKSFSLVPHSRSAPSVTSPNFTDLERWTRSWSISPVFASKIKNVKT